MDAGEQRIDAGLARLRERGVGPAIGFGERPAVVVLDFTRGFTEPGMPLAGDFSAQLAATDRLLGRARRGGHPIYFTTTEYDDAGLADAGVWALKVPASISLLAGTPGVELDPRLGRRDGEAVIAKKYASAFFGTDLATRLVARGIDTLLLAGCTTSGCVRATAVDGLQHGFRVMVVRDAVGDRDPDAHVQSMLDLQAKYADVVSLDDVDAYLELLGAEHVV